jgi:3alpha(or 20beta)-hydroxysteroid dehydrogenase
MAGAARLEGRVALITGGARGQGAAEARRFAEEGARVVIADVLDDEAREVAAEIGDEQAIACRLDVTSEADWDAVIARTEERFGALHALVNNAGIGTGAAGPQPVEALPAEDWRQVIEVNLTGNFLGLHASAALLQRSAKKLRERDPVATTAVVNVSSAQAFRPSAHNAAYAASKWGQRGLTRVTAIELAPLVRVNAVMPGPIRTPMIESMLEAGGDILQRVVDGVPLGRIGEPEDVASLVLFLCSEEARYLTGAEIPVEGGRLAGT